MLQIVVRVFFTSWLVMVLGCSDAGKPILDPPLPDDPDGPQIPVEYDRRLSGAALNSYSLLRKMSFHLRGFPPMPSEYREMQQRQQEGKSKAFFMAKTNEYLASLHHVNKMSHRLEEMFRLRPALGDWRPGPRSRRSTSIVIGDSQGALNYNALNELFRSLAKENRPWRHLLLAKDYRIHAANFFAPVEDLKFLAIAAADQIPANYSGSPNDAFYPPALPIHFGKDDARIAGSITTARFFGRYRSTNLNKNRRRAAAVFRIFLCDNMQAVVVDETGSQEAILDQIFPEPAMTQVPATMRELAFHRDISEPLARQEDSHGSDPACMKCHYKLDPLGKTFQSSPAVLGPLPAKGALVFRRADGKLFQQPVAGLAELAQVIVAQPEYQLCQVNRFWEWFIGQDYPLDDGIRATLVQQFNSVDERTNDFIKYLLMRPEFLTEGRVSEVEQEIIQVKGVLKNCAGCHSTRNIPSFTEWPIGKNWENHRYWLKRIFIQMDIDSGGQNRLMPPSKSIWQPSQKDYATIKSWKKKGAPSVNGKTHVEF